MGLLIANVDGEGSNMCRYVRTSNEGIEDREVVGDGGNRDVSVQGALSHGIEGVVRTCYGDEIGGGEEATDGIQELWRESRWGHGFFGRRE